MKKLIIAALLLVLASPALATMDVVERGVLKKAASYYTSEIEYYIVTAEGVRILILRDADSLHTQKLGALDEARAKIQSKCNICHRK